MHDANEEENDLSFDTFLQATLDFDNYSTFFHHASILFNEKGKKLTTKRMNIKKNILHIFVRQIGISVCRSFKDVLFNTCVCGTNCL